MSFLAPRIGRALRPAPRRAIQCLRQHPRVEAIPRLRISQSTRQQSTHTDTKFSESRTENFKRLFKSQPYMVSTALLCIAAGVAVLGYINFYYHDYIIGAFTKFPEPVAKQLRKALFYTNVQLDSVLALKYYKEALKVAAECGMDQFSDEIIGVKIQVAYLMEKISQFHKAIDVLEAVKRDLSEWLDRNGELPGNEGDRTRILAKTIQISIKLGELYANEYVMEKGVAEERLIWGVETVLREKLRREKEGVKEGEGRWMSDEEIGASLETLGMFYEEKNQHYLATPLFLQALSLSPPASCHTAVLMNNLSISLAQQDPPPTPGQAPVSRDALVENARAWAKKAIAVTAKSSPPERTEECDMACAVATHNLGEFAEMDGNVMEARKMYEEAKSLAKAIKFKEGVVNADKALKRLANG